MNTEQERAEFEAWAQDKTELYKMSNGDYSSRITRFAFEAYQAGRATLQSQDLEDAVERLIEAVRNYMSFGCPVCSGDCFSANQPVSGCPAREAQEAIDHARRIEGEAK